MKGEKRKKEERLFGCGRKNKLGTMLSLICVLALLFTAAVPPVFAFADDDGDDGAETWGSSVYEISDFLGTWEGEYAGHINSTVVMRHFILILDAYSQEDTETYTVSGTFSFSASDDPTQAAIDSSKGSYKMSGKVSTADGSISSLTGTEWLDQPSGFSFITFNGQLDEAEMRMEGTSDNGTFWCEQISELSDDLSVVLKTGSKEIDLLTTSYSIASGATEICTIIASAPSAWDGSHYGTVALTQDGKDIVSNSTGAFIDFAPGVLFEAGKTITAVFKDSSGSTVTSKALKLTITGTETETNTISSKSLKKGDTVIDKNGCRYQVTSIGSTNTVQFLRPKNKNVKTVQIPNYLTNTSTNTKFYVTSIAKNACKGYTKIKTVSIGSKVKTIGANAFYGCSALTKLKIKTSGLTSKRVGAKAFSGLNAKAVVSVPKKKLSTYKTILKAKGLTKSTQKIKSY